MARQGTEHAMWGHTRARRSSVGRRRALTFLAAALVAAASVAPTPADARARTETTTARVGFLSDVSGFGCVPATVARPIHATRLERASPVAGATLDDGYVVRSVRLTGGRVIWTVAPTAEECAQHTDEPDWPWIVPERSWTATFRSRLYVLKATPERGVVSVAGFQLDDRGRRRAPTISRARAFFGRPSSQRPIVSYGVTLSCRLRWNAIGLTIGFSNFGGNACSRGVAQSVRLEPPQLHRWGVMIGAPPVIAAGTTARYLESTEAAAPADTDPGWWSLASVSWPYGDGGDISSVSARATDGERIWAYEAWVGAAGD